MSIQTKAKFNFQKGTVKQIDIRKLSKEVGGFVRRLNAILQETSYIISLVADYVKSPFEESSHIKDDRDIYTAVYLRKVTRTPDGIRNASDAGLIQITGIKDSLGIDFHNFPVASYVFHDLETIESKIRGYDLSAIRKASLKTEDN